MRRLQDDDLHEAVPCLPLYYIKSYHITLYSKLHEVTKKKSPTYIYNLQSGTCVRKWFMMYCRVKSPATTAKGVPWLLCKEWASVYSIEEPYLLQCGVVMVSWSPFNEDMVSWYLKKRGSNNYMFLIPETKWFKQWHVFFLNYVFCQVWS